MLNNIKLLSLVLVSSISVTSFAQSTYMNNFDDPRTIYDKVGGYKIYGCTLDDETEDAFNFCSKRAVNTYKRLAKKQNVNLVGDNVLVSMETLLPYQDELNMSTFNLAAVNYRTKEVLPFPFTAVVIPSTNASPPYFKITKSRDAICGDADIVYNGNIEISSYGDEGEGDICFGFSDEYGFGILPTYRD